MADIIAAPAPRETAPAIASAAKSRHHRPGPRHHRRPAPQPPLPDRPGHPCGTDAPHRPGHLRHLAVPARHL